MEFITTRNQRPERPMLVEIRTRRSSYTCGGYDTQECYFDGKVFLGLRRQDWVDMWRPSPNDSKMDEEIKKCFSAKECANCLV